LVARTTCRNSMFINAINNEIELPSGVYSPGDGHYRVLLTGESSFPNI